MSAMDLIKLLEDKELLSERNIEKLRRQVLETAKPLSSGALAKLLVKKDLLTERLAKKLLRQLKDQADDKADQEQELRVVPDEEPEPELMPLDDDEDEAHSPAASPAIELEDLDAIDEASDAIETQSEGASSDDDTFNMDDAQEMEDILEDADEGSEGQSVTVGRKKRGLRAMLKFPARRERKKVRANRWDSPLLLVGGGALLLLVFAAIGLYFYLFRGTGDDVFSQAMENYRQQSYGNAINQFEQFLSDYPDHPKVSQARVTIGVAKIRSTVERQRWEESLATAREELAKVEGEEAFGEARPELASLLPEIMEGFADQALAAGDIGDAQKFLDLANDAFDDVNNSAYLPTSVRQGQQQRIEQIQSKLEVVKHRINQDKELARTVTDIQSEAEDGNIAQAYELRKTLLKKYPGLENDERLESAVIEVTQRERESVASLTDLPPAQTTDHESISQYSVVLARRAGETAALAEQGIVLALAQGAAYGLKAETGEVLWRRYVGVESPIFPTQLDAGGVLVVDQPRGELVRLQADSGEFVWRVGCGPGLTGPLLADGKIFVGYGNDTSGQLVELEANSGMATQGISLPTGITVGPAWDADRQRLIQPGAHSSLYVLATNDLSCRGVYYLGHAAGSIAVPPLVAHGHILIAENPGPDFSLLHVLAPDPENDSSFKPLSDPVRLQGRVVVPLHAFGRRVLVATDRGQIHVFELDPNNAADPVRETASTSGTVQPGTISYPLLDQGRLWVADNQFSRYELQTSRGQLVRKWINSKGDSFIGPLQKHAETLFHIRKRAGRLGATVAAVRIDASGSRDGETIWETELGVPPASEPFINRAAQEIDVVTSNGALFALTTDSIRAGVVDRPKAEVSDKELLPLMQSVLLSKDRLAFVGDPVGDRLMLFDPAASGEPMRVVKLEMQGGRAASAPVEFRDGLLLGSREGPVYLLDERSGQSLVNPFQPPLQAGSEIAWLPAAVAADGASAVITDGTGRFFRLSLPAGDQTQLTPISEAQSEIKLTSPIVVLGETIFGASRQAGADALVSFDADLNNQGDWQLAGRVVWGPRRIGDQILVTTDANELLSLSENDLNWKVELPYGPLAGPPMLLDGGLLCTSISGMLWKLNAQTGTEEFHVNVGEPLGTGPVMFPGNRLLVCGGDGTVHVVALPAE